MGRTGWRLTEVEFRVWLDDLAAGPRSLVAPVEIDSLRLFRPVKGADEVCLAVGKTRWSPKELLFPRTEVLYSYGVQGRRVQLHQPPVEDRDQVLFGLRPCDTAGISRLDTVFLGDQVDPFYAARRKSATIVTVACASADPECFCTAVGGSPGAEDGSDVMITPVGEHWLVAAVTERGRVLLSEVNGEWSAAEDHDWKTAQEQRLEVETEIDAVPLDEKLAEILEGSFDDSGWDALGDRCLSCSVCAYVCPTCTCFDVHQQGDAWHGDQLRCWDACTYSLFTRHASAHNPRPDRASRYRQRLLHKFAYQREGEEGAFRCVGCGRCIALCPVGIDIHNAVHSMVRASEKASSDASG